MALQYITANHWGAKVVAAINRLIQAMNNADYFDNGTPPYSGDTETITIQPDNTIDASLLKTYVDNRQYANLLPNADFSIAQDGTSFVSPSNDDYVLDVWQWNNASDGAVTITQDTDTPTVVEASKYIGQSLKVDVTTADTSIGTLQWTAIRGVIEGYDWRQLAQREFKISFWHKHTVTGTYCVSVQNSGQDRSYIVEYTQSVADTWEKATITIAASPSAGTWDYDDGIGLELYFVIASGTTYHGTADTWISAAGLATSNQVNGLSSTSNNFAIADIQIGNADVVTGYPNYEARLAFVFRYYEKGSGSGGSYLPLVDVTSGNPYGAVTKFKVEKRAAPTVTLTNNAVNRFPTTPGSASAISNQGFREIRTANATGTQGYFNSDFEADSRY